MASVRRQRPILGTYVEIGAHQSGPDAEAAVSAAFSGVEQVHRLLSFHEPTSDLSRLNLARGKAVRLHPLSVRVLRLARAMTRLSGNRFNCTLGGEMVRRGVLPDHGGGHGLARGEATDMEVHGLQVRLKRPVQITLDGIAKGYAVDLAVRILKGRGVASGWVNAGGDLRAFGDCSLPVHIRGMSGELIALGAVRDAAVASSRISRRRDGRFPGCIVAENAGSVHEGVWSVLARRAWRADALTKVAGVAAPAEREEIVRQLGGRLINTKQASK